MRQFFENKKLIVLLISVITSFSMIAFSIFGQAQMPKPILWINDVTAIAGRMVSAPGNAVMGFAESVENLMNTYNENRSLKQQISTLQELEAQNEILRTENQELTELLALRPTLIGKTVIASSVISRSPEMWMEIITIDTGSNNGLQNNMSVLTDSGLIGRIIEVAPTSSKVQLLTSSGEQTMQVAGSIQLDNQIVHGVINRYDENKKELIMEQIPVDVKVKKGSLVTTSGLGGVSPEGLIIGEVISASRDDFALSQEVRVKPAADFADIRNVFVVMNADSSDENTNADAEAQLIGPSANGTAEEVNTNE